jgi:putative nucleotidyltransferase with HDIG domain
MATSAGFEKWGERPRPRWHLQLLENLRSQLTWPDALVGFCAAVIISLILIGFRYQAIPQYEAGQTADREVRAIQDVTYVDRVATDLKNAEAESAIPALYQLESDLISNKVKAIAAAFSEARDILAANNLSYGENRSKPDQAKLLQKLEDQISEVLPAKAIPILLRCHFSPALESRILKIFDEVLRDGIISDRGEFLKDLRSGIVVRDGPSAMEHPLADAYGVRDLSAAREFLRQSDLSFPGLPSRERIVLLQSFEAKLFPTLICNRKETHSRRALAVRRVKPVEVQIKQGQTIVRSEEQITSKIVQQLDALRNLRRARSLIWQAIGYFVITTILLYSLWRYFVFYQKRHRKIRNHTILIFAVIISELITMRLATALADIFSERFQRFQDPYMLYYGIPFAFGTLLVTLLVDVNLGILSSIILAIQIGLFYGNLDLAVYSIIGCIAGIYSIRQYKDRAAILKSGLTIGAANILCMAGLSILRQTPVGASDILDMTFLALLGGILASALASMFLPALESLFKITTDIRLLELSNLNAPILRRLAVEAPGTYHHSLMVATLAETAAEAAGANPLLVRTAAYYHDIGKLLKSEYFVENQSYGGNKHTDLSPSMSGLIIANHVKEGLHFAKEAGLPPRISDMIPQHHGTRIMTYFYKKALDAAENDKSKVVEEDFRYPGPKPQSKEAAIMMMADSVEAASRTLGDDPAPAQIKGMIDRLTDSIIGDGQLDDCDITLREIQLVKDCFFKVLAGIFHHRIDYPGYDFKNKGNSGIAKDPGEEPAKAR